MKNFYYSLIIFAFSFYITAQTTPTGNSSEVGITEGQLSVSLTGSATYVIPIAVPPGINGVVPQISLVYNSQGGNGMAGYGWNISGVSTITRIPSTKFHNNNFGTIKYNLSDNYALDGQRLIVKNGGVYGADGTVYETENFSNIKITSVGSLSSTTNIGPDYFKVEYPDGSKAYYGNINGNTSNSRSQNEYAITYWENPQKVRISYNYSSGIFKKQILNSIQYGATNLNTPINEIQFLYKNRVNPEVQYIAGLSKTDDKVLSEIKVLGNNIGFRSYVLTHDNSSLGYERLTQIAEISGDGSKVLNPTVFSYVDNQTNNNQLINCNGTKTIPKATNMDVVITGDFDGDGEIDFFTKDPQKVISMFKILDDHSILSMPTQIPASFDYDSSMNTINSLDKDFKISNRQNICTYTSGVNYNGLQFNVFKYNSITQSIEFDYSKYFSDVQYSHPTVASNPINAGLFDGDFNGDYLTDFVDIQAQTDGTIKTKFVDVDRRNTNSLSIDTGSIAVGTYTFTLTPNVSNGLATITGSSTITKGDINGDGKTDLILFRGSPYNDIQVYSLEDNKFVSILNWSYNLPGDVGSGYFQSMSVYNNTVVGSGTQRFPILIGDYNGDGKSDILFVAIRKVLISTGIAFIEETLPSSFLPPAYPFDEKLLTLDFNNDGKTDILRINKIVTRYQIGTSDGQPWYDYDYGIKIDHYHRSGNIANPWLNYHFERVLVPHSTFYDHPNTDTSDDNYFDRLMMPLFVRKNKINPTISELAIIGKRTVQEYPIISFFSCNNFLSDQNLIKDITLGNGVKESITYSPLKNGNGVYSSDLNIDTYPNFSIESNIRFNVVSKLEKQSSTVYKKQLFSYYGGVTNLEGLGFLGFRSTAHTNWHNDTTPIISTVSKFDIEQRGANTENYTVLGIHEPLTTTVNLVPRIIKKEGNYTITGNENLTATQRITLSPNTWIQPGSTFLAKIVPDANKSSNTPTDFITKSILTYESELLLNKVFKIQNTISKQYNALENTNSETITVYDAYNNPTQSTTLLKDGGTTVQTTVSNVVYDNQPAGATYYIGRPTNKKQSVEVTGDRMTTEDQYGYTNHLLSQIKKKRNNSDFITEDNLYDAFGNIKTKTITAPGLDPRITSYEYDTTNRFLTKSTDIEKLATIYDYKQSSGVLNFETNPYGLTTTYEYDSWFKKTKTIDYLGQNISYTYTNNGNVNTLVTATGSDGRVSQELFDDLGRKISSGVKDFRQLQSDITYEYDIYDRNYRVSEPHFYGDLVQNSITEYDVYGRVTKSTSFTGKIVSIDYTSSSLISKVTEDSKTKIFTKNAMGNIISMNDSSGGIINYTYFADGNLKESNYDGVKTSIEQDEWGRKKTLTDPSAGTHSYTYNSFGETTSETTPNGITTYNLNSVGKPDSKTIINPNNNATDSKTTYTYDLNSKLGTKTVFEDNISNTKITTDYSYDDKKRISQITETNSLGPVFTKKIDYDLLGRADITTNTATLGSAKSIVKTQNIYKNGYLWQIKDFPNTKTLWQTDATNARGQLTYATIGNGLAINNEYDSYGYVTKMQNDLGTTNIMKLVTEFDAQKGNLKNRNNNLFGYNEIFDFDEQDRLTSITKDDAFIYNTFNTVSTEGYQTEGGASTYSSGGALATQVTTSGAALKKTLLTTAAIGDKININFTLQKVLGNDVLNVYIQEEDPGTGAVVKYLKTIGTAGLVSFNHTVTQYSKVSLRIEKANTTTINVFIIDNVAVTKRSTTIQTYNKRGLITKNNLGDYNYKDVDPQKAYRNTEVIPTPEALTYYQGRQTQNITYNTFKSPIQIEDVGIDKVSFVYNDNNDRSVMFYGGLQNDQLLRKYRKYYSADGSMEIKQDITATGEPLEFVTYIGGDAYTAPLLVKSNGTTQNYLYLHRDYQGSILAITDQAGAIVEKRLFDPFGGILKVQDGAGNTLAGLTVLDRGYTGHEHIQSVGIINMNGRLYDPMLRRFLQPDNNIQDPFNTQNYNRYGYVLNNPLKYTDPSGESWGEIFGLLFSAYVHGASASGGELNPAKWNSNGWTNAASNIASYGASNMVTNLTNNYVDNYNKPPELGVSASSGGKTNEINVIDFFKDISDNYHQGLNDRINEIFDFWSKEFNNSLYWANSLKDFGNDIMNGRSLIFNASAEYKKEIFTNTINMSANQWAYTVGHSAPDIAASFAIPYAAEGIVGGIGSGISRIGGYIESRAFTMNEGFGVFGKNGKIIGNYKIESMYRDSSGGGTIFSIKQGKTGGNFVRWDYGLSHTGSEEIMLHSHFRFNMFGNTYGSTAQYKSYDPYRFWKFKK